MSRAVAVTAGVVTGLLVAAPAAAADAAPAAGDVVALFPWMPDVQLGFIVAVTGLIGALIPVFGAVGGAIPGTAGSAKIDADEARLVRLADQLDALIRERPVDANAVSAVESAVNGLRDDLRSERRNQFLWAGLLYAVLGVAFALFLAGNALQAVAIGAGWTAFIGTFGLRSDYTARRDVKNDVIEKLQDHVATGGSSDPADPTVETLRREARVAQAL
jgi:hypothetical protein